MKRDKSKNNKFVEKITVMGVVLLIIFSLVILVRALTDDERTNLQAELSSLSSELNNGGYDWLINYSGEDLYPSVQVFRENDNIPLAVFENINTGMYKILLTNLSENESYSTFDLRSSGDVEKINYEILQKKIRLDEIRKILNIELSNKYIGLPNK